MDLKGKAHVVCIPAPYQGHVKPMLVLAKLLFHKGFYVTFVTTNSTHQSLLRSCGPHSLLGLPTFTFHALSVDFSSADTPLLSPTLSPPFRALLANLNDTNNSPPVSCILSDGLNVFAVDVARQLGIPVALLFPVSASGFLAMAHFKTLRDKGFTPLKDKIYLENGYLDMIIDCIPSMNGICLKDLPSFIRTTDPNDPLLGFAIETIEKACKASAIVVNTFNALEQDVLDELWSTFPRVNAIGPLHLLLNKLPDDPSKSIGHSLWKEDMECLRWLDSKPPGSVLYVNFGSLVVLSRHQALEFCWGLANSQHPFLWIVRPGLVTGEETFPPGEFVCETKERGMVGSWCMQEQVLAHASVGGFLTHCGWNSSIESVSAGVPMLCMPFFADQPTNSWLIREEGVGMEIESNAERGRVEKVVRELMEGGKGMEMKSKVMDLKRKAEEAVTQNGSSSLAFEKLVQTLLTPVDQS